MEKNKKERLIKNKLSVPIKSLSLDKDELRKLCNILQERSESAAEIERSEYPKNEADPKKYEKDIGLLKEAFKIKVTIVGSDGKQLYGYIDEVFDSPNFPDNVKSFHVNSEAILRTVYNWYPKNSFDLFLDFSKPTVFNFNLMPSYETPNQSILNVHGYDATWPNGVFQEINEFKQKELFFFQST